MARLAEHCGLGRTAVLEALAALDSTGVLVGKRAAGCPNHYDLSRLVTALAAEPVREADQSANRTSQPSEPPSQVESAAPVRDTDPQLSSQDGALHPQQVAHRLQPEHKQDVADVDGGRARPLGDRCRARGFTTVDECSPSSGLLEESDDSRDLRRLRRGFRDLLTLRRVRNHES